MTLLKLDKCSFPDKLNGTKDITFDERALIRAAIAAGSNWRRRNISASESSDIQMRVSCIRSMFDLSTGRLRATPHFLSLGESRRGNMSFYMGNTICALTAMKELKIPWILDIEEMHPGINISFLPGKRRPDFIGKNCRGQWVVFESKGRSVRPSPKEFVDWKEQAQSISHINGKPTLYNIVSATYFNKHGIVESIWKDPPPNTETPIQFPESAFFEAYYRGISKLLLTEGDRMRSDFGELVYLPDIGAYVGLHTEVVAALKNSKTSSIIGLAKELLHTDQSLENGAGVRLFPDGMLVKLDPNWKTGIFRPLSMRIITPPSAHTSNTRANDGLSSTVGQKERATQNRVIKLFQDQLEYDYLGNWEDEARSLPVEDGLLMKHLVDAGYSDKLIQNTLTKFYKALAVGQGRSLYEANKAVYDALRYGVNVGSGVGKQKKTVQLINWKYPLKNSFAIAEEVSIKGEHKKRPDIVLYVNGIALGVLELKRSSVSVAEGIRQNLDNQKKTFIRNFFTSIQLVMAGNDTEGLRYGVIETPEVYYLSWQEENPEYNVLTDDRSEKYLAGSDVDGCSSPLDVALLRLCDKRRLLEFIHDFIVFDLGIKKICRHNQYFGVRAAQQRIHSREGGIIWHTQGSGKSLSMVWLAKWIRENVTDARLLIITDRTELDEQIEGVFLGVGEKIYRTKSGRDLLKTLNRYKKWLICSLVHKFSGCSEKKMDAATDEFIEALKAGMPTNFRAKGELFVFVDECHRTQSGKLHKAMSAILPSAMFIGFTGTPLLKSDKQKSVDIFGSYIHTYKFDEAVSDGVVLDLRYEARDIDQYVASQNKVDTWFELKTKGLSDRARSQLKRRWGNMQKIMSSQSRLEQIVNDILMDMATRPRLMDGRGNAMLVCGSIYQACKVYDLFSKTDLGGKCAIITSYEPNPSDIKGEDSGEGKTEKIRKYEIYRRMLADYFEEPEETAMYKVEKFEKEVKKKFIKEPGQMRLLIVVDKLLTGFDAPPATYLYIDKTMRDHGLFQAICRINRLDGDDKEYGYVIDYKDLFKSLEGAVADYTSGALDGYDADDVAGLLANRLDKAKERLEASRETIKALCEAVPEPRSQSDYLHYFCASDTTNLKDMAANDAKRAALYKAAGSLLRSYANLANEMQEAGYSDDESKTIKSEVDHFSKMRDEVALTAADYLDMKVYEPAMRHLMDTYIRAEDSEVVADFEELGLIELIVKNGLGELDKLPSGIKSKEKLVAEVIDNNLRKVIIDENPTNPKYYQKMSQLLDALIEERRKGAIDYKAYLAKIKQLSEKVLDPSKDTTSSYPKTIKTLAQKAVFDALDSNEDLAIKLDQAVLTTKKAGWIGNRMKEKEVAMAIREVVGEAIYSTKRDDLMELLRNQNEYK